jgi:hypothetical protein
MKKSLAMKSLVLAAILALVSMSGISYAEDTSSTQPVKVKVAALYQLVKASGGFSLEKALITASNQNANMFAMTIASQSASRDGAACSDNNDCKSKVCEGGSCCTDYGATCDANSHCCGHQSCTNGQCPN